MQIQISWLLQKPTDLELHCLQNRVYPGSAGQGLNKVLRKGFEPVCAKTYNKTCVTSKDSDQPVHPPSMARVLIYTCLDCLEAVEATCDQCKDSDQTVGIHRLIRVFTGRTSLL